MQFIIDFLEKNMTKAVFITVLSSILQMFGHTDLPLSNGQIPDEVVKTLIASSSGIQFAMLSVLYVYLKIKKKD